MTEAARVEAQHQAGKLTARERLALLLDPGSLEALDPTVRHDEGGWHGSAAPIGADGVVTGRGTVNGRPVFVYAKDFTDRGGSLAEIHARKIAEVQDRALQERAPIVGLFDSRGARFEAGVAALRGYGEILRRNVEASGVIPQIAVVMGPCVGPEAHSPTLCDFLFIVRDTSHLYLTGPDVVRAVTHEIVTTEELGGAQMHSGRSSVADGAYDNDVDALLQIRRLVDFLPSSHTAAALRWPSFDDANRADASLDTLVPDDPSEPYAIDELVRKVVDEGDFFEIQPAFAPNIVTGFGRIDGHTTGFVANQPKVLAGVLDADAARKAARFVRFCDCFNVPLVTLVDTPGFLPGVAREQGGIVRHVAKLLFAFAEATVPKVTVVTRKAYGSAYVIMAAKPLGSDVSFAWPGVEIALQGAALAAPEMASTAARNARDHGERAPSPVPAAWRGSIDEIILPQATRPAIARALAALRRKAVEGVRKKHGNIPL
jgi:propionyl-CoA carboxylase beta chain